jgi:hypothetical protein
MHKPAGSQRLPVEPPLRGPSHAWITVSLLAVLAAAFACTSSSETETFVAPAQTRCVVTARANATSFPSSGGSGTVEISTARECSWVVQSDAPWVVLQADARGQGDGSARFTIAANADPAGRAAALSVSDSRMQISQEGQPCEFRVSSTHQTVDVSGGLLTINVEASDARCTWSTAGDVPWITIAGGASRTGSGAVLIQIAPAPTAPRSGTVTLAGQTLTIDQVSGCTNGAGTSALNVSSSGGRLEVPVNAPSGCAWSARSDESWISILDGQTGAGNGVVILGVAATSGPPRSGTINVAGHSVTIQQGPVCMVTTAVTTTSVSAAGGVLSVPVLAGADCPWTAQSEASWISIASGGSGKGPGTVVVFTAATEGPLRTGTVNVAGVRVTVTQLSGCRYTVQPTTYGAAAAGAASSIAVQTAAGCPWSAEGSAGWITLPQPSGTGAAAVPFAVAANNSPARTGTFQVAGSTITVVQGSPCTWTLTPPSVDYQADGGRGAILVIVAGECTWSAASTADWVTIDTGHSGAGDGLVQFIVSPNPGPARLGILRIAGIDVNVRQSGR